MTIQLILQLTGTVPTDGYVNSTEDSVSDTVTVVHGFSTGSDVLTKGKSQLV